MDLIVQATPGSTNHYGLFETGDLDAGTGYTPTDYWANEGKPPLFDKPLAGVYYTIAPITISKTHVVVRADSKVKTLTDLNGKKVYLGDPGAASTQMAIALIELLGIKCNPIQTARTEGFEMLKDGRVDVLIQSQGTPYASIIELATATDIRFIPFSDGELKKCIESGPYCFAGEILPSEYSFVKEPVKTLTQVQNINVRATLEDDVVYRLTKDIAECWDEVVKVVPAAGKVNPLKDATMTIAKLHPGAIKYYEENGVAIPAGLKP
jgi:TRAP transporter TAXI family solute receptor